MDIVKDMVHDMIDGNQAESGVCALVSGDAMKAIAYDALKCVVEPHVISGAQCSELASLDMGKVTVVDDVVKLNMCRMGPDKIAASTDVKAAHGWQNLMLYSAEIPEERLMVKGGEKQLKEYGMYMVFAVNNLDILAAAHFLESNRVPFKKAVAVMTEDYRQESLISAMSDALPFQEVFDGAVQWLELCGYRPVVSYDKYDIPYIQSRLHMTNVQFANYFGFKLRTVENWRRKPESCPSHIIQLVLRLAAYDMKYLSDIYGSEYIDPTFSPEIFYE